MLNLTDDHKWLLINKFITFKLKQKPNALILKQSMPEIGVWIDDEYFSANLLIKEVLNAKNSK
jgi:hypothetical protein